eukprot:TRINITY_DN6373_c0_g2_i1.p1 TRINITY_DN6373_c0_g2~~TRINITY_DN6373_c0_g2_i1.p1  ORF type:complete len:569 (-),score=94.57 TRINITY_DN6373_c0_g2_i1:312-1940(-)
MLVFGRRFAASPCLWNVTRGLVRQENVFEHLCSVRAFSSTVGGGTGIDLQFSSLQNAYTDGALTPADVINKFYPLWEQSKTCYIHIPSKASLDEKCKQLQAIPKEDRGPLWGLPFAVKDNIDVEGMPTTAACPAYSYNPEKSSPVIEPLLKAGAICVGKANMDQFAAGLVGTRTPYGPVPNAFDKRFCAGGSSSGSGSLVGQGLISFSVVTDTAGSGRIPAGLNGCVGIKPPVGYLSTLGAVPACRSVDCIGVFSHTVEDGAKVTNLMSTSYSLADPTLRVLPNQLPPTRPISQLKFAAPSYAAGTFKAGGPGGQVAEKAAAECFENALNVLKEMGCTQVSDYDFTPALEAAKMLYGSSFVCERVSGVREFLKDKKLPSEDVYHVTNKIFRLAEKFSAPDVYDDNFKFHQFKAQARVEMEKVDFLVVPTVVHHFLIDEILEEEMQADPQWTQNASLGYYTNFVNLLDMSGVAVPAGTLKLDFSKNEGPGAQKRLEMMTKDGGSAQTELPYGVTFLAPAFHDNQLWALGSQFMSTAGVKSGKY